MRIRVAPQARADLDAIWLYSAQESGSSNIATRAVGSITDKFGLFSKFPNIGKSFESELRPNVRTFPVNNYVIFYSVKPGRDTNSSDHSRQPRCSGHLRGRVTMPGSTVFPDLISSVRSVGRGADLICQSSEGSFGTSV
jgi:plasmid stabilization system protein ParE